MISDENEGRQSNDTSPSSRFQTTKPSQYSQRFSITLRLPDHPIMEAKQSPDATPRKKSFLNTPKGTARGDRKLSFSSKVNELDNSQVEKERRSSFHRDYSLSPSKPTNRQQIGDNYDPARIEKLLRKFPRQPHEARRLAEFMIKWNPYFRSLAEGENGLSTEAIFQICQKMEFEEFAAGKVVIKEGEPSNKKFYVIYSGEAAVVVKKMNVYMKFNVENDKSMMDNSKENDSNSSESSSSSDDESVAEPVQHDNSSKPRMSGISEMPRLSVFSHVDGPRRSIYNQPKITTGLYEENPNFLMAPVSPSESLHTLNLNLNLSRSNSRFSYSRKESAQVSEGFPSTELNSPMNNKGEKKKSIIKLSVPNTDSGNNSPNKPRASFSFKGVEAGLKLSVPLNAAEQQMRSQLSRRRGSSYHFKALQEQPEIVVKIPEATKKVKKIKTEEEIREKCMKKSAKFGHLKDIIYKDFAFGERALIDDTPRGATIFTLLPTKLLAIKAEEFTLIKQNYEPEKKRIFEFMIKSFPDLDQINQIEIVRDYIYLLEKRTFDTGNTIVQEGAPGEVFYLLYQGHVEFTKTVYISEKIQSLQFNQLNTHMRMKPKYKQELKVCTIETPGTFICEEILFEKRAKYHFTIKSLSSPAVLFAVKKNFFWLRATPTTRSLMQKNYMEKTKERVDIIHKKIEMKFQDPKINVESIGENESLLDEKFMNDTNIVRDKINIETSEQGSITSKLRMKTLARKFEPPKNDFQLDMYNFEPTATASRPNLFASATNFKSQSTRNLYISTDQRAMTSGIFQFNTIKTPMSVKNNAETSGLVQFEQKDRRFDSDFDSNPKYYQTMRDGDTMRNDTMRETFSRDFDQLKSILELGNDIKIATGRVPKKQLIKNKMESQTMKVRSEGYEIANLEKNYIMSPIKRVTSPKANERLHPLEEIEKYRLDAAEVDEKMQRRFQIQKLLELPRKNNAPLPKTISSMDRNFSRILKIRKKIQGPRNEFSEIDVRLRMATKALPAQNDLPPSPLPREEEDEKFFVTSQEYNRPSVSKEKKKNKSGNLKPPSLWNLDSLNSLPAENETPVVSRSIREMYVGNPPDSTKERHMLKNLSQSEMLKFKHKTNNRLKTKLTILTARESFSPKKTERDIESPHTTTARANKISVGSHRPKTFR